MEGVDALNSGLYFNAAQATANEAARQAQKKNKTEKPKKSIFSSAFEKAQAEHQLISEGLPPEIAGMSMEEAVVYLKDAADIAAEKLKSSQMPDVFADYRKKVSQFMKYIVKNNFNVVHHTRAPKRGRKMAPQTQIVIINQKLDEMAQWLLHSHAETLQMLAKIEEVNGLLVDLMAT
ncbi:MAG: YaaR family protein [Treponema sp.]|nr:YaaR family protein [Treponema sp.]